MHEFQGIGLRRLESTHGPSALHLDFRIKRNFSTNFCIRLEKYDVLLPQVVLSLLIPLFNPRNLYVVYRNAEILMNGNQIQVNIQALLL